MGKQTIFLTLNIFSLTGGIEKVCRVVGKALFERAQQKQESFSTWSMHDRPGDAAGNVYFPGEYYRAFSGEKAAFVRSAVTQGSRADTVILSHINLLPVGWMIKKISPQTRLILFAHGVEIWEPSGLKKRMLTIVDRFWAISSFTRNQLEQNSKIPANKITVLNNCLDPLLPLPKNTTGIDELAKRYGISKSDQVLFVLNRLSADERYKGYDKVIESLRLINRTNIKYIIAGKADSSELARLQQLITAAGLRDQVKLAGYIPDHELPGFYQLADIYIMPSSGEGFGIVFLEAMYYGLPVIAGNRDGSVDALLNGRLGKLVDPENVLELADTIERALEDKKGCPDQQMLMEHFGYAAYKRKLEAAMLPVGQLQSRENILSGIPLN